MFNLDQAITEWRRQMAAAGIKNAEALNELESHLRDDVEQHVRSGLSTQQAFEAATQRIGQASVLKNEFEKVGQAKLPLQRTLKSLLCAVFVGLIVLACAYSYFAFEMALGVKLLGFAAVALLLFSVGGWRYVVRLFPIWPEDPQAGSGLSTFTPSAKQTLELARAEAPRFHHDFIGTEHVLLGLLTLENDSASNVLRRLGVDREAVRLEIEKLVGVGSAHETTSAIPFTPRAEKALVLAAREAKTLNHAQVGTGHIILGLLLEGSGVAALVLKNLGLDIERTREEICKISAAGS
jgi:hypothetical protein